MMDAFVRMDPLAQNRSFCNYIRQGNTEQVQTLIDYGINVNQTIDSASSMSEYMEFDFPLIVSVENTREHGLAMVELLLGAGADTSDRCVFFTALVTAAQYSNTKSTLDTVKLLIERRGDIAIQRGGYALAVVCEYSHSTSSLETVKVLIDAGIDANGTSMSRYTPLMLASLNSSFTSSLETVKLLVESGADLNVVTDEGYTAVMLAVENLGVSSNLDTIKYLVEAGADLPANDDIISRLELFILLKLKPVKLVEFYIREETQVREWDIAMLVKDETLDNVMSEMKKNRTDLSHLHMLELFMGKLYVEATKGMKLQETSSNSRKIMQVHQAMYAPCGTLLPLSMKNAFATDKEHKQHVETHLRKIGSCDNHDDDPPHFSLQYEEFEIREAAFYYCPDKDYENEPLETLYKCLVKLNN